MNASATPPVPTPPPPARAPNITHVFAMACTRCQSPLAVLSVVASPTPDIFSITLTCIPCSAIIEREEQMRAAAASTPGLQVTRGCASLVPACPYLHGEHGTCLTCGAPGVYDIKSPPNTALPTGTNWIWWNSQHRHWECGDCWLK